ncbi:hypothetical protein HMPREF1153_1072 [Selenomonas sp. CM52]|nr:hypothetical protein HMPREF1153_1072 [Selenomonas sp. CM52]
MFQSCHRSTPFLWSMLQILQEAAHRGCSPKGAASHVQCRSKVFLLVRTSLRQNFLTSEFPHVRISRSR